MTEEDKILLNSYLDQELDEEESSYVEGMLKSSVEARKYLNNLKRANLEIDSIFNSSSINDIHDNIDKFIDSKKTKRKIFNNFLLKPIFIPATASLALLIFILIPNDIDNNLDKITEIPIIYDYSSSYINERGDQDSIIFNKDRIQTFESVLAEVLNDMTSRNINVATIKTDSFNIDVQLDKIQNFDTFKQEVIGFVTLDEKSIRFVAQGIKTDTEINYVISFQD